MCDVIHGKSGWWRQDGGNASFEVILVPGEMKQKPNVSQSMMNIALSKFHPFVPALPTKRHRQDPSLAGFQEPGELTQGYCMASSKQDSTPERPLDGQIWRHAGTSAVDP